MFTAPNEINAVEFRNTKKKSVYVKATDTRRRIASHRDETNYRFRTEINYVGLWTRAFTDGCVVVSTDLQHAILYAGTSRGDLLSRGLSRRYRRMSAAVSARYRDDQISRSAPRGARTTDHLRR